MAGLRGGSAGPWAGSAGDGAPEAESSSVAAGPAAKEVMHMRLAEDLELLSVRRQMLQQQLQPLGNSPGASGPGAGSSGHGGSFEDAAGSRRVLATPPPAGSPSCKLLALSQGPGGDAISGQLPAPGRSPGVTGGRGGGSALVSTSSPKRAPGPGGAGAGRRLSGKDPWGDGKLTGWEDDASPAQDAARRLSSRTAGPARAGGAGAGAAAARRPSAGLAVGSGVLAGSALELPPRPLPGPAGARAYASHPSQHAALSLVPLSLGTGASSGHDSSSSFHVPGGLAQQGVPLDLTPRVTSASGSAAGDAGGRRGGAGRGQGTTATGQSPPPLGSQQQARGTGSSLGPGAEASTDPSLRTPQGAGARVPLAASAFGPGSDSLDAAVYGRPGVVGVGAPKLSIGGHSFQRQASGAAREAAGVLSGAKRL